MSTSSLQVSVKWWLWVKVQAKSNGCTYNNDVRYLLATRASESHLIRCFPLHTPKFKLSWARDSHSFKLSINFLKSSSWMLQPRRDRIRMLLSCSESQIPFTSASLRSSPVIWMVPKSISVRLLVDIQGNRKQDSNKFVSSSWTCSIDCHSYHSNRV